MNQEAVWRTRQTPVFKALGYYLYQMRRSRGLTIEVVSCDSSLSESSIFKIEEGRSPSLNNYLFLFSFYAGIHGCPEEDSLWLLLVSAAL